MNVAEADVQKKFKVAPGHPGLAPAWSSASKSGVGTANSPRSRVWFTLAEGIVTETFYPRLDIAATRDLQFMVADGRGFFSEQRRDTVSEVIELESGVPAYRLKNTCKQGHYILEQEIVADPARDAFLIRVRFEPLQIEARLFVLLAPHLGNHGWGNDAWIGDFKSTPMLFAQAAGDEGSASLALACSRSFRRMSAGYVGFSDGWQDVHQHGEMQWEFESAPDGNVALVAEIDVNDAPVCFELALGFGSMPAGAALNARAGLIAGFNAALQEYTQQWRAWQNSLDLSGYHDLGDNRMHRISAEVLKMHESKDFSGAMVASLSTPWGEARGDGEAGYHMVWTRDLIESFGGLVAAGAHEPARRVLTYLHATQECDGHWPQNMWVDGAPHWSGIQLDEVALPILAAFLGSREPTLDQEQFSTFWPTVQKSVEYLIQNGPVTRQGRWEELAGYSTYTLAVMVSALLAAAEYGERIGNTFFAEKARTVADAWNSRIEEWTYVSGTDLAKRTGVEGYYAFLVPSEPAATPIADRPISVPGWKGAKSMAGEIVSPDALALVRFGLRSPHDPRILNTLKVIDSLLKVETPFGPCWKRYNGDRYGEGADGSPYTGGENGVGRAWPLLTGERAHYELAAGNRDEAIRLMKAMEAFANSSGFLPEQIWDAADIPDRNLFLGRPTGSAMPLVWAHAEYLKLRRSIRDNRVFDMPAQTANRYLKRD